MFYVTYAKTANKPAPMSFDDFYMSFFNTGTTPYLDTTFHCKPSFHTIEVPQLSESYKNNYRHFADAFIYLFEDRLDHYVDKQMDEFYTTFHIPKHSGGMRTINAPKDEVKQLMRTMLQRLQNFCIYPHTAAYAYVPGRSTKDALERHKRTHNKWFLKIDLKDFFGSCTFEFTVQQLLKIPLFALIGERVIRKFVHFACLNGALPQGSPLSPFITNQIMVEFDYKISKLCRERRITYTRYADDMLFSGTSRNAVMYAKDIVSEVLQSTPLRINHEKTRVSSIYGKNWNLGLMLNKDHQITVGYRNKERLRATIHNFAMNQDQWNSQLCSELLGIIEYYRTIEPDYIASLLTKCDQKYMMNVRDTLIRIIKGE